MDFRKYTLKCLGVMEHQVSHFFSNGLEKKMSVCVCMRTHAHTNKVQSPCLACSQLVSLGGTQRDFLTEAL